MVTWGTPLGCRRATVARPTLKATPTGAALSPKLQLGEAVGSTLNERDACLSYRYRENRPPKGRRGGQLRERES